MKRYVWDGNEYIESSNGNVVFYEDVKGMLEYKDQLRGFKLETEMCNCADMADSAFSNRRTDHPWICPAHGYKRL